MAKVNRWIAVRYADRITVARDYGGDFGMVEQPDEDHLPPFAAPDHETALDIARESFARLDVERWNGSVKEAWGSAPDDDGPMAA